MGAGSIAAIPHGATVGSSSLRRQALIRRIRPDINVITFRGLVDTRLRKLADGEVDATLLAFAGLALWPRALATASDIDPVCTGVVEANARANDVSLGAGRGALTMVVAAGMDDPLLQLRGPYDLLIANILAGPLVSLAPDFAKAVPPGGSLLLAGLLAGEQEAAVKRAMHRAGFRMAARLQRGDWAILWLRRRSNWGRRPRR